MQSVNCSACNTRISVNNYYQAQCPVINNVTYNTNAEAIEAESGKISLIECSECGLIFNYKFSENKMNYNQNYNNFRASSKEYQKYLDNIIRLISKDCCNKTKILEVGCGKGDFLKKLCHKNQSEGFGYDLTYEGAKEEDRVKFFKKYFDPKDCSIKFDVIILRHVLEHIFNPVKFFSELLKKTVTNQNSVLWIEVPDFNWIIKQQAFYDITYEHCNYFTEVSLNNIINLSGFEILEQYNVFSEQYLLLKVKLTDCKKQNKIKIDQPLLKKLNVFNNKRVKFQNTIKQYESVYVWGAQGKGVSFVNQIDSYSRKKIKYLIDINPDKANTFIACSGKEIKLPEILKKITRPVLIIIMNKNYQNEIQMMLDNMNIKADILVA